MIEMRMTDSRMTGAEFLRKRRNKNIALGAALAGLYVLFYIITVVRMGGAN
jgi:hypothetical protein